jgi:beta-glucanase (GH16 family)
MKPKEQFLSGLLTTQHAFSAAYGYWEMRAKLPAATRTWAAFWLLPSVVTPSNGGAAPEIDIVESYAGVMHGGSTFHGWSLDRTGRPISAIHLVGGKVMSCGATSASATPLTWHTYGVLWAPTRLMFYVDGVETCEEDVAISDPHYLLVNLAMDGRPYTPGPTSPAVYPATMSVDWVRHRPLRPGS